MAERLCARCTAWLCASSDAFCGACGTPCADLRINAYPPVVQTRQLAPRIGLKLLNGSCARLTIQDIDVPHWAPLAGVRPTAIDSGETLIFYVRPRTSDL